MPAKQKGAAARRSELYRRCQKAIDDIAAEMSMKAPKLEEPDAYDADDVEEFAALGIESRYACEIAADRGYPER